MDSFIKEVEDAKEDPKAALKVAAQTQEWYPLLEKMKSNYTSAADLFMKAEKTPNNEIPKQWLQSELNLTDDAFTLADTDKSGGLSYMELQDYGHFCLAFVAVRKMAPG